MADFERQETVICSIEVKDSSGTAQDPATSTTITITDPSGSDVVSAQAMTKDSTGNYHYDYTPGASAKLGTYEILYICTDGSRVTRGRDSFTLSK